MQRDDAEAAVALHVAAMPDFFLTSLGDRFLHVYYTRLVADRSAIAKVAINRDGVIVGVTVGSIDPAGFYGRLLRRSWLLFGLAALPAVIRSPQTAVRVLRAVRYPSGQPVGDGVAGLYSIVVAPSVQGQGIGQAMIREFVNAAGHRGSGQVYLHADAVGNDSWNDLLRRTGWELRREFMTPEGRPMNEYWHDFEGRLPRV